MTQATDQELMRLVKQGDSPAFALLLERHKLWLRRILYHLLWNWEDADDGVQEVFLRVWLAREKYEPKAQFRTWLFTIARNYWINRQRQERGKGPHLSLEDAIGPRAAKLCDTLPDREPTPEAELLQRYERFCIRQAINALPEKQYLVFVLCHFEGLRYAEISELLGIPEGTVKSRMSHAVTQLRENLGNSGGL